MSNRPAYLDWIGIVRLGLVQTALGAVFVFATSTINRIMVIELSLPAILPGLLIALHYLVQILRPRLGWGSDVGGRKTPWIFGGMVVLAAGGFGSALATVEMARDVVLGLALAVPSFLMIGVGVGAAGTTTLALLAKRTSPRRRPAAAALVWIMMIVGFVLTASLAGHFLDPFSPQRLVTVSAGISAGALVLTAVALFRIEGETAVAHSNSAPTQPFRSAVRAIWAEPQARRFAIFIFVSMLAYGGEDLLVEPFAGVVAGMTPGSTAKLAGMLHGGALLGMILVAVTGLRAHGRRIVELWMVGGCVMSGLALVALAVTGLAGAAGLFAPIVFTLGAANGVYAVAAIGTMMQLAGGNGLPDAGCASDTGQEGTRMGIWGAAQALAFGSGGLLATMASDAARATIIAPAPAYAAVFAAEASVFLFAAALAANLLRRERQGSHILPRSHLNTPLQLLGRSG